MLKHILERVVKTGFLRDIAYTAPFTFKYFDLK